jgi:hypothetical protein
MDAHLPHHQSDWINVDGTYRPRALDRFVPLYPLHGAGDGSREAAVAHRASFLLAWPGAGRDRFGRRRLRGPILASLELAASSLDAVPDVWHRRENRLEPFEFLRRFARDSVYGWLAELWCGQAAWFTTTGLDVQRIVDAPWCDAAGRLQFELRSDTEL